MSTAVQQIDLYPQRTRTSVFPVCLNQCLRRILLLGLIAALPRISYGTDTPSPLLSPVDVEARTLRIYETRQYLADRVRLERVAYPILQAASPYCLQNRRYSLGIPPVTIDDLPQDLQKGFLETLSTKEATTPLFLQVAMLSPLRTASVRDGDRLLSLTDTATGKTLRAGWMLDRPANTLAENMPFSLKLSTGGEIRTIELRAQLICNLVPQLVRKDALTANVADGAISVSSGLLRFITNDDELALILANAIAHNILPRTAEPITSRKPDTTTLKPYSAAEERAADYLATYIQALAGYDGERSTEIWRRVTSNLPSRTDGGLAQLHPLTAERAMWQRAALAEIRRKKLNGQQLAPDRKSLPANINPQIPVSDEPLAADAETSPGGVDSRLYRVADVPFIDNAGRTGYQRFLNTPLRPRAFAIGAASTAWAYRAGTNAAAEALKTCSTPAIPCYLYAVDDAVVWNPETAERAPQASTDDSVDPRLSRIGEVPLINSEGRAGYERFLNTTLRPRAFAISPNGSGTAAWAFRSGANAPANALAYCHVLSRGRPCYLYAVDDRVIWTLQGAPTAALLPDAMDGANGGEMRRRPTASGFADVKDLSAVPLPQDQQTTYRAFLEKPSPRAFVVTREGFGRYWLGAAAMEDALSYCERLGESCWLYAVDNDVVWQEDVTKRISRRSQLPKQSEETQFLK